MALVAEYRDQKDTGAHLRRMSRFSGILASTMGMGYQEAEDIRYASPLHDVGKVAIPDAILRKPGKLTPEEYDEMKRHTIYGSQMLSNAESRLLRLAGKIAVAHHEHFDGSGYPYGLKGEAIPIEARIVSVADVFDALVSKRVYKGAWTVEDALKYIKSEEGKLFDPRVIDCLHKSFDEILTAMEEENRRIVEDNAAKVQAEQASAAEAPKPAPPQAEPKNA